MIFFFTLFLLTTLSSGRQQFCAKRTTKQADDRNAIWYPESCVTDEQPLGFRCHLKCKEGYAFEEGALMFSDCINTGLMDWSNLGFDICREIKSNCTVPKGEQLYDDKCRPGQSVPKGTSCYFEKCGEDRRVGPSFIECHINGKWKGGGSYCKPVYQANMKCPTTRTLTLETDVHSSTVDARRYLTLPTLSLLNPSEMKVIFEKNDTDVSALGVGEHKMKFTSMKADGTEAKCNIIINVQDKEKPRLLSCTEEKERFSIPGYTALIEPTNCTFQDNVDGIMEVKYPDNLPRENFVGKHNWEYRVEDSSKNKQRSPLQYIVRGKDCKPTYPVENTNIQRFNNNEYQPSCANTSYQNYGVFFGNDLAFRSLIDTTVVARQLFNPCNTTTFITKLPVLECYYKFPLQNGSCPTGRVKSLFGDVCIPCPKSFYYNTSSSSCLLCPANTTTTSQGSTSCVPCPNNSMAVETIGPRRCQYFCKPGEAYTRSGCVKCGTGEYVEAGVEKCMSCPKNTTTLKEQATSQNDCVPGVSMDEPRGSAEAVGIRNQTFYFHFNLKSMDIPNNQLEQRAGIRITSAYLSAQIDCTKDYIQVIGYFGEYENDLTGTKICGNKLNESIVVKFRPWRINLIRVVINNSSASVDVKVSYAIGAKLCPSGMIFNLTSQQCEECTIGTFQQEFNGFSCPLCTSGKTNYANGQTFCIDPCPSGFGSNGSSCFPCPMNTYENASSCVDCPDGEATAFESSTECLTACTAGEYRNGTTCVKCPRATYQPLIRHAQSVCRYCKPGYTTLSNGSTNADSCIKQCRYEGEYYNVSSKSCQPCPRDTYKIASGFTVPECMSCPDGFVTNTTGSIRKSDCRKNETTLCEKNNPCVFPGRCVENGTHTSCICPKYHTGEFCEEVAGPCRTSPCQNNGTCHPLSTTNYTCLCRPGYTGRNCTSEHDPCEPNPCYNSNCTSMVVGRMLDFNCSCPTYWSGKRCTHQLPRPCTNMSNCVHGTCDDDPTVHGINNFTCTCYRTYEGPNCNISINNCERFPCDKNGTKECTENTAGRTCKCKPGYSGVTCNKFEKCPAGAFHQNQECCQCWHGTYNTDSNIASSCKNCSDGKSTLNRGSNSSDQCIDVTKINRISAQVLLPDRTYQGKIVKIGCGALVADFEKQLKEAMKGKGAEVEGIRVDEFMEPPAEKSGLVLLFIIFGKNMQENRKALKEVVSSGKIGDIGVDKEELKINYPNRCPAGAFYQNQECCQCWHGTYNTDSNIASSCKNCPDGESTMNRGSNSSDQCIDVTKLDRFSAQVLVPNRTYPGKIIKTGCGSLAAEFEQQLKEAMKGEGVEGVRVDEYMEPPANKNGMVFLFTIFGKNILAKEEALKEIVSTGKIGKLNVDKDELKIKERHTDTKVKEKTNRYWIYILIGVVIVLLLLTLLAYYFYNTRKSAGISPKKGNVNPAYTDDLGDQQQFTISETT